MWAYSIQYPLWNHCLHLKTPVRTIEQSIGHIQTRVPHTLPEKNIGRGACDYSSTWSTITRRPNRGPTLTLSQHSTRLILHFNHCIQHWHSVALKALLQLCPPDPEYCCHMQNFRVRWYQSVSVDRPITMYFQTWPSILGVQLGWI